MSMFSVCTAFAPDNNLDGFLRSSAEVEKHFTRENGVLDRRFFQCLTQKQIIWAYTEWTSEEVHNDAAQMILKERRDDRVSAIRYGPDPYFEIFAHDEVGMSLGSLDDRIGFVVVGRGLVAMDRSEEFNKLLVERWSQVGDWPIPWLRYFENDYHDNDFVFFMGFKTRDDYEELKRDPYAVEEYLFTGIDDPLGMTCLAGYNQYLCVPLDITSGVSAV